MCAIFRHCLCITLSTFLPVQAGRTLYLNIEGQAVISVGKSDIELTACGWREMQSDASIKRS